MSFSSWLRNWRRSAPAARRRTQTSLRQPAGFRPRLEVLEDRSLPSTLTVTNAKETGAGTLRAEIAAAHSGDTIVFSPSLVGQTITLTKGELAITKNLTIQGPGASQLTISGYHGYARRNNPPLPARVFDVAQNATFTLSGLTISHGDVESASSGSPWDGYGGGILNHGTLTVSGCTLDDN